MGQKRVGLCPAERKTSGARVEGPEGKGQEAGAPRLTPAGEKCSRPSLRLQPPSIKTATARGLPTNRGGGITPSRSPIRHPLPHKASTQTPIYNQRKKAYDHDPDIQRYEPSKASEKRSRVITKVPRHRVCGFLNLR
jgi:hypothetical protein